MENSQVTTASSGSSLLKRLFLRIFRWFGRLLIGVAALVTVVALFYAEEDWRGWRAWKICERGLVARGVELDWHKLAPPPVPDAENFAMTPFLAPLLDLNPQPLRPGQSPWRDTNGWNRAMKFAAEFSQADEHHPANQPEGQLTDFDAWLQVLPRPTNSAAPTDAFATRAGSAAAVLAALAPDQPVLDELRAASRRPHSRFNLDYGSEDPAGVMLPHLSVLRRVSQVLFLKSSAELAAGDHVAAHEDVTLMFALAESLRGEPLLVSHLVRGRILHTTQRAIWEGLAQHAWTDAQLSDLAGRLRRVNLLVEIGPPLAGDRGAFGVAEFQVFRKNPRYMQDIFAQNSTNISAIGWFGIAPTGWLYQEEISYQRVFEEELLPGVDLKTGLVHPHVIDTNLARIREASEDVGSAFLHHRLIVRWLLGGFGNFYGGEGFRIWLRNAALDQTAVDLCAVACALERQHLAHGEYPETLAALSPPFPGPLPVDVCTGQPLHYRRTDGGRFLIYSVGWNETDDGGKIVPGAKDELYAPAQGDWTWPPYPGW